MCKDLTCHKPRQSDRKPENEASTAGGHVGELDRKGDDKLEAVLRQLDEIRTILDTTSSFYENLGREIIEINSDGN